MLLLAAFGFDMSIFMAIVTLLFMFGLDCLSFVGIFAAIIPF